MFFTRKEVLLCLIFSALALPTWGQRSRFDSLQENLKSAGIDTQERVEILFSLFDETVYNISDSAFTYANEALELSVAIDDLHLQSEAARKLGIYNYVVGDYDKAMGFYIQAQSLTKKTNNIRGFLSATMNIGLVNAARKKHDSAISEYKIVYERASQIPDSVLMYKSLYNMAISLQDQGKYDSSNVFFEKAKRTLSSQSKPYELSRIYALQGQGYHLSDDYKKSKDFYLKAFDVGFDGSNWDETFALAGLAHTEMHLGNPKKAVDLAKKAYEIGVKNNYKWELQRVTKILSDAYLELGDFKNSRAYLLEHAEVNTQIYNEERENEIFKLRLAQKEAERLQLERDNLEKDAEIIFRNVILVVAILGFFGLAGFLFTLQRNFRKIEDLNQDLRKVNADLDKTNETKNRLFSIIGHDLKNMLSAMQGFVALFRDKDISFEEWTSVTPHLAANIDVLKLTLENLMQWGISQSNGLKPDIQQFAFTQLCTDLKESFGESIQQKNIHLEISCPSYLFIKSDVVYLELVLRNLLHNAIKFTPKNGEISMKAQEIENFARISIQDSGIGLTEEKLLLIKNAKPLDTEFGTEGEVGSGMGIQLVIDLLNILGSKLQLESTPGKGTRFWFDLAME